MFPCNKVYSLNHRRQPSSRQSSRNTISIRTMSRVTDRSLTWHSSSRSSKGSLPHSWQATFRRTSSFRTTNQPIDRGIPRRLHFLRFSLISWTQLTRLRWRCSSCWTWVQPSTPWTTTSSWQGYKSRTVSVELNLHGIHHLSKVDSNQFFCFFVFV